MIAIIMNGLCSSILVYNFTMIFLVSFVIDACQFVHHHFTILHVNFHFVFAMPPTISERVVIPALGVFGDAEHFILDVLCTGLAILGSSAEEPAGIALTIILVLVFEVL